MNRFRILVFISVFVFFPWVLANSRVVWILHAIDNVSFYQPVTDTIYQFDTLYQHVIIYDTIFYEDSPPETDTIAVYDTLIENTDSAVIIKKSLTLNLKKKKTVYFNQDLKFIENPTRKFDEPQKSNTTKPTDPFTSPGQSTSQKMKRKTKTYDSAKSNELIGKTEPFTYFVRDTVYFYDTIIHRELVLDTVFFKNSDNNHDTTILRFTEFEKMGKLVLAIETVKYTVNRRESVFAEKNSRSIYQPHQPPPNDNLQKKTTGTPSSVSQTKSSHWRKNTRFAPREFPEKNIDYTTLLLGGVSVFEPSVTFSPENEDSIEYTNSLNSNSEAGTSWGTSFTYGYFQNRVGYEAGLGYSKHNFDYNHIFEETDIDTSQFWEYFEKEIYNYDTTWYLNIDTLLQTGDTLFIPSVDSTMIQVTDSIQREDYDTTFLSKSARYNYSYSYLEIPLIGRLQLFEGKLEAHLAAGVIPTFLVSKSGKMPTNKTGSMADAGEITYDYGFSLSGYCALSFLYHFYGDYSLFVEPYIKRNLFTTLKNDQFLMKNNSWGIRFGLSYTLFTTKNRKSR